MIVYGIFVVMIIGLFGFVTIKGKDLYPFSHNPMFAKPYRLNEVKIIRIALENEHHEVQWWKHKSYRYPEFIGRRLKDYHYQSIHADNHQKMVLAFKKIKLLREVFRLIELQNQTACITALHIIERTVDENLIVREQTIEIIPLSALKNGKHS